MITLCFVHFKNLTLANLRAALYSVRAQNLSAVKEMVVLDNDSGTPTEGLYEIFDALDFPFAVHLRVCRHGDPARTHAWSSNQAVAMAAQPWVFFTRSDYLLDSTALQKFAAETLDKPKAFVTSNGCHLSISVEACEQAGWRQSGLARLPGSIFDYTAIDAGVWMARRAVFDAVGGLDERLSAWGHAQTHFQWKLHKAGVEFVRIPEVLFYHPAHGGEKDLGAAHRQLADIGLDIRDLWARYDGPRMY